MSDLSSWFFIYPLAFLIALWQYIDMVCLYCHGTTRVINSRPQRRTNSVWRRRACETCGATVTTTEKPELGSAILVTSTDNHQPFSRDKLFISILDSLKHRKTSLADASGLTDTIIGLLYPLIQEASISRDQIIVQTQLALHRFDRVAAVHYKAFHPVNKA